jgi:hypothetical protein
MEKQIAAFIRNVMNMARVPSDDQFQQNLIAAKQWLEAIAAGKLLVVSPAEPAAPTEPANPDDAKAPQEAP